MAERDYEVYGSTQWKQVCEKQGFCLFDLTDILSQIVSVCTRLIWPWDTILLIAILLLCKMVEETPFSFHLRKSFQCRNNYSSWEIWLVTLTSIIPLLSAVKTIYTTDLQELFNCALTLFVCLCKGKSILNKWLGNVAFYLSTLEFFSKHFILYLF